MIVVDTNVLSEPLRPSPDPAVLKWLVEHHHEIAITTVTIGELVHGTERLPAGKRRERISRAVSSLVEDAKDRILSFDLPAAVEYGRIRALRESSGHNVSAEDTVIAAICRANGAALATRNTKDFAGLDLEVINPWSAV